jgi:hypothetical protein
MQWGSPLPMQWGDSVWLVCLLDLASASLGSFLSFAGILDFDVDVTGPHCIIPWRWQNDLVLQMCLPFAVRLRHSPKRDGPSRC